MRLIPKKYFILVSFFSICSFLQSQISMEVKQKVESFPEKMSSINRLASMINQTFATDEDKVGAIYYWIAKNITFNTKEHYSSKKKITYSFKYKTQAEKEKKIAKVDREIAEASFDSRKAVAKEYTFIFKKLCENSGIECEIVHGTSKRTFKDIGRKAGRINHYWNAVKMKGEWLLTDVTWGAGILNDTDKKFIPLYNEVFFLKRPDVFYYNHYPKDTEWLFVDKTKEDFGLLPLLHPAFVETGLTLDSPKNGLISTIVKNRLVVVLSLDDTNGAVGVYDRFTFALDDADTLRALRPTLKGNKMILVVPLVAVKYDYITIFRNNEPLVSFKIKMSRT